MSTPSALEQFLLEYINEARMNPLANAARYIASYTPLTSNDADIQDAMDYFHVVGSTLQSAYSALTPVQPLAWNENLGTSASGHTSLLVANNSQSHQEPGEAGLGSRATNAGYNWNGLGENVYSYAASVIHAQAAFMIDWATTNPPSVVDGMQSPPGHRNNIMSSSFREVGIGLTEHTPDQNVQNPVGPMVITEDFGYRPGSAVLILGVAYNDSDHDAFYTPGEGLGTLNVTLGASSVTSYASGGYTLQTSSTGSRSIVLSGAGLSGSLTVAVNLAASSNVKLDVVDGNTLLTSTSVAVTGTLSKLAVLGLTGLTLQIGGSGTHTLLGNAGADTLIGGSGSDALDGGAGVDRLYGGVGNDSYTVEAQTDIVFENASEGTDSVASSASFYLYANIENLTLTGSAIYGVGNDEANAITGNAQENLLIGWNGNDTLDGGAARDALYGVEGDDTLYGQAGIDYIVAGNGNDTVYGGNDADEVYGEDGNDLIYGGDDFATDILVGGSGNDTIDGGPAWDQMYGNAGDDTYYVSQQVDWVFEQPNEGTDTVIADSPNGYYLFANVENLTLAGTTSFGVGNELDNALTGNASANVLLAGAGSDRIDGQGGNDVLFGEAGADTFVFRRGSGADAVADFAPGTDKVEIVAIYASYAAMQSHMVQNGGSSAIDLGAGDIVVLQGVLLSQLSSADFLFT